MSSHPTEWRVALAADPAKRLDKALADALPAEAGLSRSRVQNLIAEGAVTRIRDGQVLIDPRFRAEPGLEIVVAVPAALPVAAQPEPIALDVVHEDNDLVVVNKPAGLVVHPAPGAPKGTLVNALLHHCGDSLSGIGGALRPGIVHRIDKDTSGLLVVAKSDVAHQGLAAQFAAHDVERRYLAVLHGVPDPSDPRLAGLRGASWEAGGVLCIRTRIGRHPGDRKRMAVLNEGGKLAVTRARVLERFGNGPAGVASLVECRLETGRTHQIRVHLTWTGHPLVGDAVYGRSRRTGTMLDEFPRQALHAETLGFRHPVTGVDLRFEAPVPEDMRTLIDTLSKIG